MDGCYNLAKTNKYKAFVYSMPNIDAVVKFKERDVRRQALIALERADSKSRAKRRGDSKSEIKLAVNKSG